MTSENIFRKDALFSETKKHLEYVFLIFQTFQTFQQVYKLIWR